MTVLEGRVETVDGVGKFLFRKGKGDGGKAFVVLVVSTYAIGSNGNKPALLVKSDEAHLTFCYGSVERYYGVVALPEKIYIFTGSKTYIALTRLTYTQHSVAMSQTHRIRSVVAKHVNRIAIITTQSALCRCIPDKPFPILQHGIDTYQRQLVYPWRNDNVVCHQQTMTENKQQSNKMYSLKQYFFIKHDLLCSKRVF